MIEFEVPLFAAATCLHGNYATGETAILCKERRLVDVHGFDAIHGHREAKPPRGGIGDVGRIYHQSASLFSAPFNFDLSVGSTDNTGNKRKSIRHRGGPRRESFHFLGSPSPSPSALSFPLHLAPF